MEQFLSLLSNPALLAVVTMALDALMRMVPTEKPWSIAHVVAATIRTVGHVATGVADFLDKVLPQKTKA